MTMVLLLGVSGSTALASGDNLHTTPPNPSQKWLWQGLPWARALGLCGWILTLVGLLVRASPRKRVLHWNAVLLVWYWPGVSDFGALGLGPAPGHDLHPGCIWR